MSTELHIQDETLELAGLSLALAAARMRDKNVARPTEDLETVSNIGTRVTDFVLGLQLARFALSDAAKTAATSVSTVMEESQYLDEVLATSLQPGFAMPGGRH